MPDWRRFEASVRRMREAQKRYFRTRDRAALLESKEAEKAVDDFLETGDFPPFKDPLPQVMRNIACDSAVRIQMGTGIPVGFTELESEVKAESVGIGYERLDYRMTFQLTASEYIKDRRTKQ